MKSTVDDVTAEDEFDLGGDVAVNPVPEAGEVSFGGQ